MLEILIDIGIGIEILVCYWTPKSTTERHESKLGKESQNAEIKRGIHLAWVVFVKFNISKTESTNPP